MADYRDSCIVCGFLECQCRECPHFNWQDLTHPFAGVLLALGASAVAWWMIYEAVHCLMTTIERVIQ